MTGSAAAFSAFAEETYARPGVQALCLTLQDQAGLEVNLLLLCLYAGLVLGRRIDPAPLAAATRPFAEAVVGPLRLARRGTREWRGEPAVAALTEQVRQAELAAERLLQARLWAALESDAPTAEASPALASANLLAYGGPDAAGLVRLVLRLGTGAADPSHPTV